MSIEDVVKRILAPFNDVQYQIKKSNEYVNWLRDAKKGDKFTYHIGLSPQESYISCHVAAEVYKDYQEGYVFPFRIRKGPGIFEFIVVRSGKK